MKTIALPIDEGPIWLSSDAHFGHFNILKFCPGRTYKNLDHMHMDFVDRWNSRVGVDDMVIYLGDFSMSFAPVPKWKPLLNGKIYLIPGNHDKCFPLLDTNKFQNRSPQYLEAGFHFFGDDYVYDFEYNGKYYVLSHFPPVETEASGEYQIRYEKYRTNPSGYHKFFHGHVHQHWQVKEMGDCKCINVGVDVHDFYPIKLQDWL